MVLLFLTGAPLAIAFCVGSSIIALFVMGMPFETLAQTFFSGINSYPLLACPFFILTGELIIISGAMGPLRDFMQAMFGHRVGGVAVASIIFAAFLGSVSGSSAACLAILGGVILPIMTDVGYDRPFSSGLCLVSGELGLMIPPSVFFILFGSMNQISIPDLFLAGIGPGLLTAILMCLVAIIISKRRKYPIKRPLPWKARGIMFIRALPVLLMPIVVLGGIYSGIFSPTQAASVSAYYAIIVGLFIYRNLKFHGIIEALIRTVRISSMIYLLVISADIMSRMFGYLEIPQMICDLIISWELGPISFLLVVELFLVLLGFVFIGLPTVIAVLPLFLPTVMALGIDPVLYGVLGIFTCLLSEITPPVGGQLWISVPICGEKMGAIAREGWPFMIAMTLAMLLVTFIPGIATFLVTLSR